MMVVVVFVLGNADNVISYRKIEILFDLILYSHLPLNASPTRNMSEVQFSAPMSKKHLVMWVKPPQTRKTKEDEIDGA